MKVFLWRPTWAHFHLELLWQFAIEDRIWVETLNYPVFDPPKTRSRERQTDKKHFSLEENPLKWWAGRVFSFIFSDLQLFFFRLQKLRHRSGASEAGIRILNVLLFGNIWNSMENSTKNSSSKLSKKLLRNSQLISFLFLAIELLENREFLSGILWVMRGVRKKNLATNLEFPGTEMYDKPEILYRSFLPIDFFHSIFWLEVSRDFGQFLRRLGGSLWVKFEGFAGSLKVAGILGSFIAAVHPRRRKIIASKSGGSRAGGDSNRPSKKP
jgi:hypothetical protein